MLVEMWDRWVWCLAGRIVGDTTVLQLQRPQLRCSQSAHAYPRGGRMYAHGDHAVTGSLWDAIPAEPCQRCLLLCLQRVRRAQFVVLPLWTRCVCLLL